MRFNKYILLLSCCGALTLQSCEDFLDTKPTESYGDDVVWSSQGTVDAVVLGNYGNAISPYTGFDYWDKIFTNNLIACRSDCPGEARGLMENTFGWGLNDKFGAIRHCNLIIAKVAESSVLNDRFKKQYTAEAKMMRAMIYFDLARKGGRYIWVDRMLNQDDEFNLPLTKDIVESYQHILDDMRAAIPDLPTSAVAGRLTKNAGLAFLSEICLTAAAYTEDAAALRKGGKSLYEEAVEAVNEIKGVSLDPNFGNIFNENGAYTSPEIILATYQSAENTTVQGTDMIQLIPNLLNSNLQQNNCGPSFKKDDIFEGWLEHAPSQNIVDAFLVIDQKTNQAVRWYESSQFKDNTEPLTRDQALALKIHRDEAEIKGIAEKDFKAFKVKKSGVSISDLMYNHRDKRFDATIVHDGSTYYGEEITCYNHGNVSRWATKRYGQDHVPLTNYLQRKGVYTNCNPRPFYNVATDYHKVVFRYGRALLNKAEALLRLKKVAEAVKVINETRTVHGGLPESTASTLADAWKDYKIERRVELYYEGDFYFSLLRWGKYGHDANDGKAPGSIIDELCKPATFIEIATDRSAAFVGNVQFSNDKRNFDVRSYLFPITKGVIQANGAITDKDQNPGWE